MAAFISTAVVPLVPLVQRGTLKGQVTAIVVPDEKPPQDMKGSSAPRELCITSCLCLYDHDAGLRPQNTIFLMLSL